MASTNRDANVLVICDDDRYLKWAKLLLDADANCIYAIRKGGECRSIDETNIKLGGRRTTQEDIPNYLCCVLVHSGDMKLWARNERKARKVFWFNKPGDPVVTKPDLPILRETSPFFDITLKDTKQILDYSLGRRNEIPECCLPKYVKQVLPAIAILCQGYLATHFSHPSEASGVVRKALDKMGWTDFVEKEKTNALAKEATVSAKDTNDPEWWQNVFDMPNDKLVEKVEEEWDAEELPNEISELLEAIFGEAKLDDEESAKKVAGAYLEIAKNLRGKMS